MGSKNSIKLFRRKRNNKKRKKIKEKKEKKRILFNHKIKLLTLEEVRDCDVKKLIINNK